MSLQTLWGNGELFKQQPDREICAKNRKPFVPLFQEPRAVGFTVVMNTN